MFRISKTDGQAARPVRRRPRRSLLARLLLGADHDEPLLNAMADRARAVIARQPGHRIDVVAQTLRLSPERLEHLMTNADGPVDPVFLVDVVAALVHESGIDPKWLLTGQYDPAMHRKALLLGEDRSPQGADVMRAFVEEEFRRVLDIATLRSGG